MILIKIYPKEPYENRQDNDEVIEMGGSSGLRRNDSNLSISSKMVSPLKLKLN